MYLDADLSRFVPPDVRARGAAMHREGRVRRLDGDRYTASAEVQGLNGVYFVDLECIGDAVVAHCQCPYFDDRGLCKHIWATLLAADKANYLLGDPKRGRRPRTLSAADLDDENLAGDQLDEEDFEEDERSFALLRPQPGARWKSLLAEIQSGLSAAAAPARPRADREYWYLARAYKTSSLHELRVDIAFRERKKTGEWGKLKCARISRQEIARAAEPDREALTALGGTPTLYDYMNRDSIGFVFTVAGATAEATLRKLCATGRCAFTPDGPLDCDSLVPLEWDEGDPWTFRLRLDPAANGWRLDCEFQRGADRIRREGCAVTRDGFFVSGARFRRYADPGFLPWWVLLDGKGPIDVPAKDGDEFVEAMLARGALPAVDWPESLKVVETAPQPRAMMRITKGQQSCEGRDLCAWVKFDYEGTLFGSADPQSAAFDKERRVCVRRDPGAERARLGEIEAAGFKPATERYRSGMHYHVAPKKLSAAVSAAMASGWHVELDGRAFRNSVSYTASISSGVDWFDLQAEVDFGPVKAALPDLLRALRGNSNLVHLSDGSFGIIPDELIQRFGPLLGAGSVQDGAIRYSRAQASLLDALLASRPEIAVDETFQQARDRLRAFDRIPPAEQPAGFRGQLRHYQAEGLSWMLFLQDLGFGGCLADDMGLGKTAQVLALLETRRQLREAGQPLGPSLAVVPRSLVFNWKREAERFTPAIRIRDYTGLDRKRGEAGFSDCDLVLTTYGTLRRDIAALQDVEFDYAILDEAQAIKNSGSDAAKAARLIRARHRLALSGTPIENHVGELFSLFGFLNPGMLGPMQGLVGGASLRNPDEPARALLAAAVRPFLLRRTKQQVAPELPERTEQTVYCQLEKAQRKKYEQLRDYYRGVLLGRVERQGIAKSQMYILEALLRLRQAACHPGLLDENLAAAPSAKTEALMAQIAEVMEEGHKALVFSQFTTFLEIVRKQLDAEGIRYEYLDGQTRDRQERVDAFQNDDGCKLFLISLKAGGLGLNLTAAEYVFLLDPWWNPAVEAQAIDRAHRIGQANRVFAYRLIARDTVEEKVLELQARKRDLADSIIRADASLVRNLKREDLDFLLS